MPFIPAIIAGVSAVAGAAAAKKGSKGSSQQQQAPPPPPIVDMSLKQGDQYHNQLTRLGVFKEAPMKQYRDDEDYYRVDPREMDGSFDGPKAAAGAGGPQPPRFNSNTGVLLGANAPKSFNPLADAPTWTASQSRPTSYDPFGAAPNWAPNTSGPNYATAAWAGNGAGPVAVSRPDYGPRPVTDARYGGLLDRLMERPDMNLTSRVKDFVMPQALPDFRAPDVVLKELILPELIKTDYLQNSQVMRDRQGIQGLVDTLTSVRPNAAFNQGVDSVGQASNYYNRLLGNRTEALSAIAPEVEGINDQYYQQSQLAARGPRGGGRNALLQQLDDKRGEAINTRLASIRPEAANRAAEVGNTLASLGLQERTVRNNELTSAGALLSGLRNQDLVALAQAGGQQIEQRGQNLSARVTGRGQDLQAATANQQARISERELMQRLRDSDLSAILRGRDQDIQQRGQDMSFTTSYEDRMAGNLRSSVDAILKQRGLDDAMYTADANRAADIYRTDSTNALTRYNADNDRNLRWIDAERGREATLFNEAEDRRLTWTNAERRNALDRYNSDQNREYTLHNQNEDRRYNYITGERKNALDLYNSDQNREYARYDGDQDRLLTNRSLDLQELLGLLNHELTSRGQDLDSIADHRRMDIDQLLGQRGQAVQQYGIDTNARLEQRRVDQERWNALIGSVGTIGGAIAARRNS